MKKILVLLGIVAITPLYASAKIHENATSNIDVLRGQGYSESTLQLVDTAKYQNEGKGRRYFVRRANNTNPVAKGYTYVKTYLDPAQDDGMFGEHQINFSNSWTFEKNYYANQRKGSSKVDNL